MNDLLDSIETEFSIECIPCSTIGYSHEPTVEAAAVQFEKDGWKRDENGYVECPDCQGSA